MRLCTSVVLTLLLMLIAQPQGKPGVLGRLGQARVKASIYAKKDLKSKVYYHLKATEYCVVISTTDKAWLAVLLQNGQYGYVLAEKVVALPYDVKGDRSSFKVPDWTPATYVFAEYESNELRADKLFKGERLVIRGIAGKIGKESSGKPYVILLGGDYELFGVKATSEDRSSC